MHARMSDRAARGMWTAAHGDGCREDSYCTDWSAAAAVEARAILADTEATASPTDRMWRTAADRDASLLALADALRSFVEA